MIIKYKLSEEIIRWAFEVQMKKNKNWYIAFTNPTAGPWKKINIKNINGRFEEGYRFASKETRPDLIIINDIKKEIIIIEAKDSIKKLLDQNQIKKTIKVVQNMSSIECIKTLNYKIHLGLLWGGETREDFNLLFEEYYFTQQKMGSNFPIMGFEILFKNHSVDVIYIDNLKQERTNL